MASSFEVVTVAKHPPEKLFDMCLDVGKHVASMRNSRESAVAGVTTGTLRLNDWVTWRARHFGLWFEMTVTITALDRPYYFVDQQTMGPFATFRHAHRFEARGEATNMVDTVTVASPVLGRIAEQAILVPYLRRLITNRNLHLLSALDASN